MQECHVIPLNVPISIKNDNKKYVDLMIIFLKTSQRIFIAKRFDSFNFKEESIIPDGWNTIDIMPVIS